jgi:hypothetical protein
MSTSKQLIGLLVAAALASGCGSSATLTLRDGRVVERKIVRSDAGTVWVKGIEPRELKKAAGRDVVVEREDGEKFVGRLDAQRSSVGHRNAWREVCVQRDGDAPGRPFCIPGPDVEVTQVAVRREDIADVSHPGIGAIIAGGVLLGIAGFFMVKSGKASADCREADAVYSSGTRQPSVQQGEEEVSPSPCWDAAGWGAVSTLFFIPGAGLETYGLVNHLGSRSRYAPPELSSPMKDAKGIRLHFEF